MKLDVETLKNKNYRKEFETTSDMQIVLMSLKPGEEIGNEVHKHVDQFFRLEGGEARFVFNGKTKHIVKNGGSVVVPAGTFHNIINNSKTKKLKLYTVYSPPNHPKGTIHKTKADAERAEMRKHH